MTDYDSLPADERTCTTCAHYRIAHVARYMPPLCERETVPHYPMDRRSTTYARSAAGQCGPEGKRWEAQP